MKKKLKKFKKNSIKLQKIRKMKNNCKLVETKFF